MSRSIRPALLLALFLLAASARGQDLVQESIPWKWIDPLLPEDLPDLKYPAYFNDVDKAQAQSFAGRYKLSLSTIRKNIKDPKPEQIVPIALTKTNSLAAQGRWEEALAALAADAVKDDPRIQLRRAEILSDTGHSDDALALLKALVEAHPDSIGGHYLLGAVSERVGDLEAARRHFSWFVEAPQKFLEKWETHAEGPFDRADDVTLIGRAIDRWANLTGAYRNNVVLHRTIFNIFVKAYDVIDRTYWPAHVAAAEYFISHDQRQEALEELQTALRSNPNDARIWRLIARLMIDAHQSDKAESAILSIRRINPSSADADVLDARNLLRQDRADEAQPLAQRVLQRLPRDLEALGLMAAVHMLRLQQEQTDSVYKRIAAIAPKDATAYFEVAEALFAAHDTAGATKMYQAAVERAPWWAAAQNQLGLALMQDGQEEQARAALDAAYAVDPYNVRSVNYLRLLDLMAAFPTYQTPHFIFRYDAQDDPIVPLYIAPFMEESYAEVCRDFEFTLPWKMIVEVFPEADSFSVRTAGMPGLESFGASLGRVMTVVAPRAGETLGPFNFARVLRHEFTHTVNLTATNGRCPRWLTEGLAVWEEKVPYRFVWVPPEMYERATRGKLFSLPALQRALLHPGAPHDGEVAYMEGFWIVRYLRDKHGPESILRMLDTYKQGKSEADAVRDASGQSIADFEKSFFAWAKQEVKGWGYDPETRKRFKDVSTRGDQAVKAGLVDEGVTLWKQAQELQPMNPLPHRRLAGLCLKLKRPDEAASHLEAFSFLEISDNRFAKMIARIHRDAGRLDKAEQRAMEAVYINPYDPGAHELLAQIYEKTGNTSALEREQKVIPVLKQRQEAEKEKRSGKKKSESPAAE